MIQGWHNDDYLILFEELAVDMTDRYAVAKFLPGFTVCGLKGWDDFILRDAAGQFYTAPTLPLVAKHLKPYSFNVDQSALQPDSRFADKIKWYVQPLVLGVIQKQKRISHGFPSINTPKP